MHTFDGYNTKNLLAIIIGWNPRQLESHHFDGKANCYLLEIALLILSDLILDEPLFMI